jgi:hypothetical protein
MNGPTVNERASICHWNLEFSEKKPRVSDGE